jgi:hypothetical protein
MKFIKRLIEWFFPSRKNIVVANSVSEAFEKVRKIVDSQLETPHYYLMKVTAIQNNVYEWEVVAMYEQATYWHEMNMRWGR